MGLAEGGLSDEPGQLLDHGHLAGDVEGSRLGNDRFLAAMASVDTQLYEAARMDGAGRLRQIWHITLPAIRSVIVVLLILRLGTSWR